MSSPTVRSSVSVHRTTRPGDKPDAQRVLVIGGTLFIGRLLVTELLHAGHQVHILHRKPGHPFGRRVHELIADRNDVESVRAVVGANRFDAIYDLAYDWERGTTCAQVESIARLFDGKVFRYVFMSSVAAYGDGLNHHEGDALAPDDHANAYARNKAMTERALFRLHQRTGFPIVTLRPPFVYGTGNPFYREAFFWDRMRAGRRIILPSEGHRLMQFVYVHDLVEAGLKLLEQRNVVGHAFNIANPRAITQHELILELARSAGAKEPEMVAIPREWLHRMGGQVSGEKLYFGAYYDLPAITEIITKAQRMLAFKPTEFATGLKATYRAYSRDHTAETSFTFEDELFTMFARHSHATRSA